MDWGLGVRGGVGAGVSSPFTWTMPDEKYDGAVEVVEVDEVEEEEEVEGDVLDV